VPARRRWVQSNLLTEQDNRLLSLHAMLVLSRNASLYSTSRIVLAARARGHEVNVIDPSIFRLSCRAVAGALPIRALVARTTRDPRIGASPITAGRVRQFDMMGVPVSTAVASRAAATSFAPAAAHAAQHRRADYRCARCRRARCRAGVGGGLSRMSNSSRNAGIGHHDRETPQRWLFAGDCGRWDKTSCSRSTSRVEGATSGPSWWDRASWP